MPGFAAVLGRDPIYKGEHRMLTLNTISRRCLHISRTVHKFDSKRPTSWNLPDLDKLPGGFRGKVYNKKDWNEYLDQNTATLDNEINGSKPSISQGKAPPAGWRKNPSLPQWLKNKYALKEKAMKVDLSNVKRLSPTTAKAIRKLHDEFPEELPNEKLAEFFKVSPLAIAKILKSRWTPSEKEFEKSEKRWEKYVTKQVSRKMVESKFTEFIEETERRIKMEMPPFFKQQLHEHYMKHGIDHVKNDFEELNRARIEREKLKDGKLSNYLNSAMVDESHKIPE